MGQANAQQTIRKLEAERKNLDVKLKEEKNLNDKNSSRIKEIESILDTMDKSISWMQKAA